jgi:hypothetical protein
MPKWILRESALLDARWVIPEACVICVILDLIKLMERVQIVRIHAKNARKVCALNAKRNMEVLLVRHHALISVVHAYLKICVLSVYTDILMKPVPVFALKTVLETKLAAITVLIMFV